MSASYYTCMSRFFIVIICIYGFTKPNCCSHALFTVTESAKHFTKRSSSVYYAFLDASKAFEKVLHNGIYKKLLERGAPVNLVRVLQYWCRRLHCRVRWHVRWVISCFRRRATGRYFVSLPVRLVYRWHSGKFTELLIWNSCWSVISRMCSLCWRHRDEIVVHSRACVWRHVHLCEAARKTVTRTVDCRCNDTLRWTLCKTELKRCTTTNICWDKNEDARTSPVVSTNRQLPNSLKTEQHPCWLGRGTPPQSGRIHPVVTVQHT